MIWFILALKRSNDSSATVVQSARKPWYIIRIFLWASNDAISEAPLRTPHDGRVLIVCTPKLNALFSGKDSFLTTILHDGNPTTAIATRINKGGNSYSKRWKSLWYFATIVQLPFRFAWQTNLIWPPCHESHVREWQVFLGSLGIAG